VEEPLSTIQNTRVHQHDDQREHPRPGPRRPRRRSPPRRGRRSRSRRADSGGQRVQATDQQARPRSSWARMRRPGSGARRARRGSTMCWARRRGHQGDHGPQDHGFVAGREALVVAGGAGCFADPGERPLHNPPTEQHPEGVRVAPAIMQMAIFKLGAQPLSLPV
jgi:hypothetical protein